jgi:hypothetical protein
MALVAFPAAFRCGWLLRLFMLALATDLVGLAARLGLRLVGLQPMAV